MTSSMRVILSFFSNFQSKSPFYPLQLDFQAMFIMVKVVKHDQWNILKKFSFSYHVPFWRIMLFVFVIYLSCVKKTIFFQNVRVIMLNNFYHDKHCLKNKLQCLKRGFSLKITEKRQNGDYKRRHTPKTGHDMKK